jgi:hypothetical protein
MKVEDRLSLLQATVHVPKGQMNKFGGYKYRSCEDILLALKPELGTAILTLTDDLVMIGQRYYVKATATLTDEGSISVTAFAREEESKKGMDSSQVTGACSSYARKYALNGLVLTDDIKDADTMDNSTKLEKPAGVMVGAKSKLDEPADVPEPELGTGPVNAAQKKVLAGLMTKEGMPKEDQKAFFNYVAPKDYAAAQIFIEDFAACYKTFTKRLDETEEAINE